MVNISLTLYTKGFFGSVLKSHTQMGSLSINNSVTNISRLGTFKKYTWNFHLTAPQGKGIMKYSGFFDFFLLLISGKAVHDQCDFVTKLISSNFILFAPHFFIIFSHYFVSFFPVLSEYLYMAKWQRETFFRAFSLPFIGFSLF